MKFSINDFFSKCDQIRRFLRICSHLPPAFIAFTIKDFFSKCDQNLPAAFTEELLSGKLHFLCSET